VRIPPQSPWSGPSWLGEIVAKRLLARLLPAPSGHSRSCAAAQGVVQSFPSSLLNHSCRSRSARIPLGQGSDGHGGDGCCPALRAGICEFFGKRKATGRCGETPACANGDLAPHIGGFAGYPSVSLGKLWKSGCQWLSPADARWDLHAPTQAGEEVSRGSLGSCSSACCKGCRSVPQAKPCSRSLSESGVNRRWNGLATGATSPSFFWITQQAPRGRPESARNWRLRGSLRLPASFADRRRRDLGNHVGLAEQPPRRAKEALENRLLGSVISLRQLRSLPSHRLRGGVFQRFPNFGEVEPAHPSRRQASPRCLRAQSCDARVFQQTPRRAC
jgi:hypothetical protein